MKKMRIIIGLLLLNSLTYSQEFTINVIDAAVDGDESHFFDLDNDNDLDIIIVSTNTKEILWYENFGNFDFEKRVIDNIDPIRPQSLTIIDFNNDTYNDIITIANDGFVYVYYNNENNEFDKVVFAGGEIISTNDVLSQPSRVKASDLNGDNIIDIVVSNKEGFSSTGQLFIYLSTINGNYTLQKIAENTLSTYNHICELKDINEDGFVDIISTDATDLTHTTNVYTNDGLGNFNLLFSKESDYFLGDASVLDINQDNELDVIASTVQFGVEISINNGDNSFVDLQIIPEIDSTNPMLAFCRALKVADWNNDSLPDVIVSLGGYGNNSDENIQIFTNQGNGSFFKESSVFFGSLSEINVFDVSDIDGDGDLDIIALSRTLSEHGLINGLTGLYLIINNTSLNIEEESVNINNLILYPNPARSIVTIKCLLEDENIYVYNAIGQLLFNKVLNINSNYNEIDVNDFKSGVYFIKNGNQILRFVIE